MTQRLDYVRHADPEPLQALSALSGYLHHSDLDPVLLQLLQLRASQLNGCAFCVDMHSLDLKALGEDGARLHLVPAWHESDVFTPAERAALAWTEALTRLQPGQDLGPLYQAMEAHFDNAAILRLTFAIVAINGWNRLSVAFGKRTGQYRPGDLDATLTRALNTLRRQGR